MKINSIKFKNICSYGDKMQEFDFTKSNYGLNLITGVNGAGKCVHPDTIIDISIIDPLISEKFKNFIEKNNGPI